MENKKISIDGLNKLSKETISMLYLQTFEMLQNLQAQNASLIAQVEDLKQQMAVLINQRFGRYSEKLSQLPGQLSFSLDNPAVFNEIEAVTDNGFAKEPSAEEVVPEHIRRRRPQGRRAVDLSGIEVEVVNHYLPEDILNSEMPGGWHRMEDETYTELERIPPSYKVVEHHVGVYASNGNGSKIMRGRAPGRLLNHSILTPSLAASIFTAKYINAVPLNRISEGYGYDGLNISRQVMAGWMIRLSDYYLDSVHRMMKDELKKAPLIHCDESPFTMSGEKDVNDPQSRDYMWVYHSPGIQDSKKIYLYEYDNDSRSAAVIDRYLEGYKGILVSDGYASCHTLDRKHDDLKVAGCWVHCKRKYAEIVKTAKKGAALSPAQQIAREAAERIAVIFHMDNLSRGKSSQEIFDNRQQSVKPLVDASFAWVKDILDNKIISSTDLKKALTYSVNQEKYLRVFLESAIIPLDNNDAERSIKRFCVGKHSWHIIDSRKGAKASAILYSIAETAKANGLNPFEYFKFLMEQLKEYPRNDVPEEELKKLMPWSETLPDCCKQLKKQS